jgi:uncharacterized membrane protein YqiK
MNLDIIVQYQLSLANVLNVFYNFGEEDVWRAFLRNKITEALHQACSTMTATYFYTDRLGVGERLFQEAVIVLESGNCFADLVAVDLIRNRHDEDYLLAHRQKEELEQLAQRRRVEKSQKLTDAETRRQTAVFDAQIRITKANAQRQSMVDDAVVKSNTEIDRWRQRGLALVDVKMNLGNVTNAELIDQYVKHVALLELRSPILTISN